MRHKWCWALLFVSATLTSACGSESVAGRLGCTMVEEGFGPAGTVAVRAEVLVSGLEVPWGIGFLPGGELLVTERPGKVRLVSEGTLEPEPVITVQTGEPGEGGLLGIAIHPKFASNRYFYLYYTAKKGGRDVNRVERYRLSSDQRSATSDQVILDDIPAAPFHNGGRIRFGPDGNLYIGTGDAREPSLSQSPESLAGKILRVNENGGIPDDNPIPGSPVYLLGIRNTQGFDWLDPGTLIVTDHGPTGEMGLSGHDEVSIARAGENLGWPEIVGCQSRENRVTPSISWRDAVPPGGAVYYQGGDIPEWQGSLIMATLGSRHLHRLVIDQEGGLAISRHEVYFRNEHGRLREVVVGPGGELYVTTSNCDSRGSCPTERDVILRIRRGE